MALRGRCQPAVGSGLASGAGGLRPGPAAHNLMAVTGRGPGLVDNGSTGGSLVLCTGAAKQPEGPGHTEQRGDQGAAQSLPTLLHQVLKLHVGSTWQRVPLGRESLPQRDHLQGGQPVRLLQVRGRQEEVGDRVRDEVATDGQRARGQLRTGAVSLQDLLQLKLHVIEDLCHRLHEAARIPGRELARVVQHISAEAAHPPHLLFADGDIGGVCSQPALQQLAEARARVVPVRLSSCQDPTTLRLALTLVSDCHIEGSNEMCMLVSRNATLQAGSSEVFRVGNLRQRWVH